MPSMTLLLFGFAVALAVLLVAFYVVRRLSARRAERIAPKSLIDSVIAMGKDNPAPRD